MAETSLSEKELFESTPVFKAIMKLAIPTVIGQIILVIYNMADTFFIGLTGNDAMITGVTVCMPAFMFLSAVSNLFGVGGASVISRSLGMGRTDRAGRASAFALWGCGAVTAAYSLGAWLFADTFTDLLGGSHGAVHGYARTYLLCTVSAGGLAASLSALLSHLIRSEGRSLQAGFGIALGGVLNIGLDPLFMFVLLPPGYETLGAALATALSNCVSLVYFIIILRSEGKRSALKFLPCRKMFSDGIPRDVFAAGLPASIMTLFENISYAVLDNLLSACGTAVQAGIGVAKKVNMLSHCIVRGMSQGVLPLIGYTYAAKARRRMRSAIIISSSMSVLTALLCMTANLLFAPQLIGIFLKTSASAEHGAVFLRILCLGGPFSAFAYAVISFFQAVGRGGRSFLLAILRKGLLDIPMMFLLRGLIPTVGPVWATPAADFICCGVSLIVFVRFLRKEQEEDNKSVLV